MTETQTGVRVETAREGSANVATGLPVLDHLVGELARAARFKLSLEVGPGSTDEAVAAAGAELQRAGFELLHPARTEPWGQTVARLLTEDGLIVGISYAPMLHDDEPAAAEGT